MMLEGKTILLPVVGQNDLPFPFLKGKNCSNTLAKYWKIWYVIIVQ